MRKTKEEHIKDVCLAVIKDRDDATQEDDMETAWEDRPAAKQALADVPDRTRATVFRAVDRKVCILLVLMLASE
jgi:hypothetical protein